MKKSNFVIGTAGHVDHGKTTLIKALSGVDTDTTREEKERGLTINLGFTFMTLPDGEEVGIVDVPGHERFVKNMLAGVASIDLVLLVIDVNEGIMPQTIEHSSILRLLGVENYIIVLTKVDDADPELKEIIYEDIQERFRNTPLADAPIVETDAVSGTGIEELKQTIQDKLSHLTEKESDLPPRLNVDRAFSVKGFGTVVTGTLVDGPLSVGDELYAYPYNKKTKIRNIQIHNKDQKQAFPGNRTALNLTNVTVEEMERGTVLSGVPLEDSYMLDVKVECLPESPYALELWDRVHVHVGAAEVLARIVPIDKEKIVQGDSGYLQLRLEEQVHVKKGDHFILRSYSPVYTVGGGTILEEEPEKHKRFNEEVIHTLQVKETGDLAQILLDFLNRRSSALTSKKEMMQYLNVEQQQVDEAIETLTQEHELLVFGHQYMSVQKFNEFKKEILSLLETYHAQYPVRQGMPLEELRSKFKNVSAKELDRLLKQLREDQQIAIEYGRARLYDFTYQLDSKSQMERDAMEQTLKDAKMTPPEKDALTHGDEHLEELFNSMMGSEIFQLDRNVYVHMSVYEAAKHFVVDYINEHGELSLGEFRDAWETSRKYGMAFLEHLDAIGLTKRVGDVRVLKHE
ncbi:MAG: selenocysteine-specific translation elongation factor [Aerococcus sp.]|nr:selenocysteine-specific translation elongation factor [Aerococcus sp.]